MKWSPRFYSVSQHPILDDYILGKAEKQLFPNKAMTREKRPGRHIHETVGEQEEEAQTALCFRPHLSVLHFWESAFSEAKKVVSLSKEGHLYLQLSN